MPKYLYYRHEGDFYRGKGTGGLATEVFDEKHGWQKNEWDWLKPAFHGSLIEEHQLPAAACGNGGPERD